MADTRFELMRTLWYYDITSVQADIEIYGEKLTVENFEPSLPGSGDIGMTNEGAKEFSEDMKVFLQEYVLSHITGGQKEAILENGGKLIWNAPKGEAKIDIAIEPRNGLSLSL